MANTTRKDHQPTDLENKDLQPGQASEFLQNINAQVIKKANDPIT